MSMGVGVDGLPQLQSRLAHAQDTVEDLTPANREAVRVVFSHLDTPRATGALDVANTADASATGWGITNAKPYAPPVHWGTRIMRARPWLLDAARATEDTWMDVLTEHVQTALDDD